MTSSELFYKLLNYMHKKAIENGYPDLYYRCGFDKTCFLIIKEYRSIYEVYAFRENMNFFINKKSLYEVFGHKIYKSKIFLVKGKL